MVKKKHCEGFRATRFENYSEAPQPITESGNKENKANKLKHVLNLRRNKTEGGGGSQCNPMVFPGEPQRFHS